jgi:hypothetical protein
MRGCSLVELRVTCRCPDEPSRLDLCALITAVRSSDLASTRGFGVLAATSILGLTLCMRRSSAAALEELKSCRHHAVEMRSDPAIWATSGKGGGRERDGRRMRYVGPQPYITATSCKTITKTNKGSDLHNIEKFGV